jgi:hypothetical protein
VRLGDTFGPSVITIGSTAPHRTPQRFQLLRRKNVIRPIKPRWRPIDR